MLCMQGLATRDCCNCLVLNWNWCWTYSVCTLESNVSLPFNNGLTKVAAQSVVITASDFVMVPSTANNDLQDSYWSRSEAPIACMVKRAMTYCCWQPHATEIFRFHWMTEMHVNIFTSKGVKRVCLAFIKWQDNYSPLCKGAMLYPTEIFSFHQQKKN